MYGTVIALIVLPFLLRSCNGELILYVRANDSGSTCPSGVNPHECLLLSEYATDSNLTLQSETTFSFLPGVHVLDEVLSIDSQMGVTALTFQSTDLGRSTSITCNRGGSFNLTGLQVIDINQLTIIFCGFPESGFTPRPVFDIFDAPNVTIQQCTLAENSFSVLEIENSTLFFIANNITRNIKQWMTLNSSAAVFVDNEVSNNDATQTRSVPGLVLYSSSLTTIGSNTFDSNHGFFGGILYGYNSTMNFSGSTTFSNNNGTVTGVIVGASLDVILAGSVSFDANIGEVGGAMGLLNSHVTIAGDVVYSNNVGTYGGACHLVSSSITFMNEGNASFIANLARNGGALYLSSGSSLDFLTEIPGSGMFYNNSAMIEGGAIFIQDTSSLSYCVADAAQNIALQECSFRIVDYNNTAMYQTRLYFANNTAGQAGYSIFGGAVDSCVLETATDALVLTGAQLFDQIVDIAGYNAGSVGDNNFTKSEISSEPFMVCACDGHQPNCANLSISQTVFPGASIQVSVIALGQRNGTVFATIAALENNLTIDELEQTQGIPSRCSNLSYTIYANPGNRSLSLLADGSCLFQNSTQLTVNVEVLDCPPGFVVTTVEQDRVTCTCDPRLLDYTDVCNVQDGTILRESDFWVGYDHVLDGLVLSSSCPFDYCIPEQINLTVEDSDAQCNHNRSGLLCGECSEGLSLLLGSSSCEKCSDDYLSLLLFFAVAGVILVVFLLFLNLTVAIGTINGLIFYANIVAANEALVFPRGSNTYLDILKVFIAWINLDFGIKSCFYDGMGQYGMTWLQYVFPVYIWALIGLVFLVSRFSSRAASLFGRNPVAVLATLILLSYAKLLRSIIVALSSATLEYPGGESRVVWLYDGNVPSLDTSDGRHLGLFIFSLLVLLLLFVPYTLLLLTSQWLQIKSHWKVLSWLNNPRLRAFLDAYHAPYKPRHRYWTGLHLLLRFAILVTAARTLTNDNLNVNCLIIVIFVLLAVVWAWINGGIYKKWYLNVIESFFFLNLGLLMSSLQYIRSEYFAEDRSFDEVELAQIEATSTLLTSAFIAFIGIIFFHLYLQKKGRKVYQLLVAKHATSQQKVELKHPVTNIEPAAVHSTFVSLRESLLDS